MTQFSAARRLVARHPLAAALVALGGIAIINHALARRAERRHPPQGAFIDVDGVRLHYTDEGEGQAVVLVHGNVVSGSDFATSGVAQRIRRTHRVITFDRPGCGHSDRPRGRVFDVEEQAALLQHALRRLGAERPIIVGHSLGAIVALAMAARQPAQTGGLVLVSGYYFWSLRPDVVLVAIGAIPILGDILRYTLAPLLGRLLMPAVKRVMFSPKRPTERFEAEYSDAMALRPSQIRATSVDGTLMIPAVLALRPHYGKLTMPVFIMAGGGDKIVLHRQAQRLHAAIPGSMLEIVPGIGHMAHHVVPDRVEQALAMVEHRIRVAEDGARPATTPRLANADPGDCNKEEAFLTTA
ncbi:MAG: alpha/beta hydrolase [Pseudomonadota bacterium]